MGEGSRLTVYKISLNRSGEIHTVYTQNRSQSGALRNAVRRLERKLDLRGGALLGYFSGSRDNVKIEEVMKR